MSQHSASTGSMGSGVRRPGIALPRLAAEAAGFAIMCGLTVWSAMVVKSALVQRTAHVPALMAVEQTRVTKAAPAETGADAASFLEAAASALVPAAEPAPEPAVINDPLNEPGDFANRWFNGRPIRPSHVMWFTVTAYTPGPESCWPSDDGITATLHSVTTNGGAMVAADTSVLPFGSLVSVEGYDAARVVPVLDRGGKIRGRRLDLLMETVEEARAWGVRKIPVVVWEYADGDPLTDPRKVR